MVMGPAGPGTKNGCAGEGQQKFTWNWDRGYTASMIGWLMNVEQLVEWELAGETEAVREHLAQCHLVNHKSHDFIYDLEFRD
jgi:hypothetical protein